VTHARTVPPPPPPRADPPGPARFLQRPQLHTHFFSSPFDGTLATSSVTAPTVRLGHRHRAEGSWETQGTVSSMCRQAWGVGPCLTPHTHRISRAQKHLIGQRGCDSPS
jgi:hypothetical protein